MTWWYGKNGPNNIPTTHTLCAIRSRKIPTEPNPAQPYLCRTFICDFKWKIGKLKPSISERCDAFRIWVYWEGAGDVRLRGFMRLLSDMEWAFPFMDVDMTATWLILFQNMVFTLWFQWARWINGVPFFLLPVRCFKPISISIHYFDSIVFRSNWGTGVRCQISRGHKNWFGFCSGSSRHYKKKYTFRLWFQFRNGFLWTVLWCGPWSVISMHEIWSETTHSSPLIPIALIRE